MMKYMINNYSITIDDLVISATKNNVTHYLHGGDFESMTLRIDNDVRLDEKKKHGFCKVLKDQYNKIQKRNEKMRKKEILENIRIKAKTDREIGVKRAYKEATQWSC